MAFCDFCDCELCRDGSFYLSHAKTEDGRNICDTCFSYDLCTSGADRNPDGPCHEVECKHRPKIVSEWIDYEDSEYFRRGVS